LPNHEKKKQLHNALNKSIKAKGNNNDSDFKKKEPVQTVLLLIDLTFDE